MIWLILWLVCGLVAWILSIWDQGYCTVGDIFALFIMIPVGVVSLLNVGLSSTGDRVIWKRKINPR